MPISLSGSLNLSGSLTTTGTITATTLVVQTITSSISSITGSTYFGSLSSNTHVFTGSLNVTGAFYVTTGSVGIGTTSPNQTLNVVGNGRFEAASGNRYIDVVSSGSSIQIATDGTTQNIYGSGGSFPLAFSTNGTEKMRITSGGNIGIGNTTALHKLQIGANADQKTAIGQSILFLSANAGNVGYVNEIGFGDVSSTYPQSAIGNIITNATAASYGDLYFATRTATTDTIPTERMRIASNGLVSIANTFASSNYKLGASGSAHINGTNNKGIFITDNATYASVVGLNKEISAYNPLEIRASGTDYQMYLNTDGRVFVNASGTTPYFDGKLNVYGDASVPAACLKNFGNSQFTCAMWNASDTGDNPFLTFVTNVSYVNRGTIDYNRASSVIRYNTSSDANLKNIIGYSDKQKSVDILNSTKIREFSWKEDETNKSQIGVIAQELYETFKGAVSKGSDDELLGTEDYKTWAVDKTAFTFHLIAGWQKHEQLIQELTARVQYLENK